jgi:hypothetical protein
MRENVFLSTLARDVQYINTGDLITVTHKSLSPLAI